MPKTQEFSIFAMILLGGWILNADAQSPRSRWVWITKANLCATEGSIEDLPGQQLSVNVPKMRAFALHP
jgi:hypothetical protein